VQLPMVVETILTDSGAQSARGISELAKAGKTKREQIPIPLFPAPATPGFIPLQSLLLAIDEYPHAPFTITTADFVIVAVDLTQSVEVTSAGEFAIDDYVSITAPNQNLFGQITAIAGTTITVKTTAIFGGAAGDTIAADAFFTKANAWKGQVMGTQITGARSGSAISVRQVLTIERQFR